MLAAVCEEGLRDEAAAVAASASRAVIGAELLRRIRFTRTLGSLRAEETPLPLSASSFGVSFLRSVLMERMSLAIIASNSLVLYRRKHADRRKLKTHNNITHNKT